MDTEWSQWHDKPIWRLSCAHRNCNKEMVYGWGFATSIKADTENNFQIGMLTHVNLILLDKFTNHHHRLRVVLGPEQCITRDLKLPTRTTNPWLERTYLNLGQCMQASTQMPSSVPNSSAVIFPLRGPPAIWGTACGRHKSNGIAEEHEPVLFVAFWCYLILLLSLDWISLRQDWILKKQLSQYAQGIPHYQKINMSFR